MKFRIRNLLCELNFKPESKASIRETGVMVDNFTTQNGFQLVKTQKVQNTRKFGNETD